MFNHVPTCLFTYRVTYLHTYSLFIYLVGTLRVRVRERGGVFFHKCDMLSTQPGYVVVGDAVDVCG